jgi:hypothetical protein
MSIRENTNRLLDGLRRVNPGLFAGRDPIQVLAHLARQRRDGGHLRDLRDWALTVREIAIRTSAVGRIETLMNRNDGISRAMKEAGFPSTGDADRRFERERLQEMSINEVEEFSGRFAILLADALSPQAQA